MRSSLPGLALALSLLAFAAGCDGTTCTRQSDCAAGLICNEMLLCVVPPPDGGADAASDAAIEDLTPAPTDDGGQDGGDDGSSDGGDDGGDGGDDAGM